MINTNKVNWRKKMTKSKGSQPRFAGGPGSMKVMDGIADQMRHKKTSMCITRIT